MAFPLPLPGPPPEPRPRAGRPGRTITWPPGGGTQTITAGDTKIDFAAGEVVLADGTRQRLRGRLLEDEVIGTIYFEPTQDVAVDFDMQGNFYTIPGGQLTGYESINALSVTIRADAETTIKLWSSVAGKLVR